MARKQVSSAASKQVGPADDSDLRVTIAELREDETKLYQQAVRSHEQLWRGVAKGYLVWRAASEIPGLLDSVFAEHGIQYRQIGNRPHFIPLFRYLWSIDKPSETDRVNLSTINQAVQALHEHFVENPEDFRHNPEGKLTDHIRERGGIAGLAKQLREPAERETSGSLPKQEPEPESVELQTRASLAQIGLAELKSSQGIGTAKVREPVRVGADGLHVLLGRQERTGEITILGSSNDPAQIDAVAASVASRSLSNLPPVLRALAEVIRTQMFPPHALPSSQAERAKWFQTHYLDWSDLWEEDLNPSVASD
jgi:hypothetical protein